MKKGILLRTVWAALIAVVACACQMIGPSDLGQSVTGLNLNKSSINLLIGGTGTLAATILPSNAVNQNLVWSSSDNSIATVSASGVVTALAAGKATITATSVEKSKTASCLVGVYGVALSDQVGTILGGTAGSATYAVATVNVQQGTVGTITWFSSSSGTTSTVAPTGVVSAVVSAIAGNMATATITTNSSAAIGTYYFKVSEGSAISAVATLTVLPLTVNYSDNGATSGSVPADNNGYHQGSTVTVLGNMGNLLKSGYFFAGWNTAANGSGTAYAAGATFTMGSTNVVLYAMWNALAAPTISGAVGGTGQATVTWSTVTGATSYNIYYLAGATVTKATGTKISAVSSPYTVTGLTGGTQYAFMVTAGSASGESGASPVVTATTLPAISGVVGGNGQATVTWGAMTGASGYNLYYLSGTSVTTTTGTKVTGVSSPKVVTGLANGTQYAFMVTAVIGGVESAPSAIVTGWTLTSAPTISSVVSGSGQATVTWGSVTGATSYNIYYLAGTTVTTTTGTKMAGCSSPQVVTGLANGLQHAFIVTAVNSSGESVASAMSFAIFWIYTLTPSPADGGTTADTTPLLDWNDIAGATGYELQIANSSAGVPSSTAVAISTSQYQVPSGIDLGTWYWRVRVKNVDGIWGAWSTTWSFAVSWTYTLTPNPANGGTTSDTTPLLDWNDVSGATGYQVQVVSTFGGVAGSTALSTAISQYQIPTILALGDARYWRVRAQNGDGIWGAWSSTWSFTVSWTYTLTPSPADAGTTSDTTPLLDWNDVSGASGYELQLASTSAGVAGSTALSMAISQYQMPTILALGDMRYWRVRAQNADGVWGAWSSIWSFTVSWTYVMTPSPPDAGATSDTTPLLDWTDVSAAVGYELQYAATSAGVSGTTAQAVTSSQYQLPVILALGDIRYWRVRPKNADGVWGAWGSIWSFSVSWLYNPTTTPANGGKTVNTKPLLDWSDLSGAASFELQYANTSGGVAGSTAIPTAISQYQIPSVLSVGTWYWRVRAKNVDGVYTAWTSIWNFSIMQAYAIGDTGPAGGKVFYDKGDYLSGWQYLEAASSDQSAGVCWYGGIGFVVNASQDSIGYGATNTTTIVAAQGAGTYAASICANLVLGGYDDWFLPSKWELFAMYQLRATIGGFTANKFYWSSTEYSDLHAWSCYFDIMGTPGLVEKSQTIVRVRAIRDF